jgi:hypothetical protein
MHDEMKRFATVRSVQVLKANESFSQGFDKPMGLGVKKKVRETCCAGSSHQNADRKVQ